MVDRHKAEIFITVGSNLLLNKNVASIAVKVHKTQIENSNFVDFISRKKIGTEVFDEACILSEFL
jgi:hypothetical protein